MTAVPKEERRTPPCIIKVNDMSYLGCSINVNVELARGGSLAELVPKVQQSAGVDLGSRHVDAGVDDLDVRHGAVLQGRVVAQQLVQKLITGSGLEKQRQRYSTLFSLQPKIVYTKSTAQLCRPDTPPFGLVDFL